MATLSEEKKLYSKIQEKLFYIIPEKWESIYLYASIIDMPNKRAVGEMYFYYFPKGIIKKKAVNCYEIPNAFNIDEDEYSKLINELYNIVKALRTIWIRNKQKKWSNVTISIRNEQFKVEYDYQDLKNSIFDSYERHIIWRYIYLQPDISLLEKKDRKIIDKYMEFIQTNKLPKKDVYMEGIYSRPAKNIVDYEKTLSVEEAIAQSEKEDEQDKKNKHHFLKRKKVVEDIIELEQEDSINNQILNWRRLEK